jgi:hypothetical protein
MCGACSSGYPVIGGIPWLFPEPRQALGEWRARLNLLTQHLASEAAAMRAEAESPLPDATRRRLGHVAVAHNDQTRRLTSRFAPLGLDTAAASQATRHVLGTRLITEQRLTNY